MKKILQKAAMAVTTIAMMAGLVSCDNSDLGIAPDSVETRTSITVSGAVTGTNNYWTADTVFLNGKVFILENAVVNIDAGTTVVGLPSPTGEPEDASALVVTRGGKLFANGTATDPIVMTSAAGHKYPGGWGGLVLLGKAPINQPDQVIEGIVSSQFPNIDIKYGGGGQGLGNPNDNSGTLRYVRVEYAGANVSEANELNSFTFGGVGKGTTLEYLQSYYGEDDGFEFFGGTVDAKYLVSTSTHDDAFDFDFGYVGRIQFAVATVDPTSTFYTKDPNGIECDNDGDATESEPFTHPKLSNFTIVGTSNGKVAESAMADGVSLKSGANFRRGTEFTFVNSIVYGYPTGVLLENINANPSPSSELKGMVISSVNANSEIVGLTTAVDALCLSYVAPNGITLTDPWGDLYGSNALKPNGNPALDTCRYLHTDPWFTTANYKGAFAGGLGNNWLLTGKNQGWILPQKNYSNLVIIYD